MPNNRAIPAFGGMSRSRVVRYLTRPLVAALVAYLRLMVGTARASYWGGFISSH